MEPLLCHKMQIPPHLEKLTQQLTRELICRQPVNILEFSTNFFEKLIKERNESKIIFCVRYL